MQDILRQIYRGDFHLEEQMIPTTEEYLSQKKKVRELEDAFYEKVSLELKDDFIELIEARIRLTGIEVEEACLDGMRIGGMIASAFFDGRKTLPFDRNYELEP